MADDEAMIIIKKATSTPFLIKLWKILSDPSNSHAIAWNPDGKGFTIEDPDALEKDVLSDHFRSTQFSSFQRQLNYFTFKKSGKRGYYHPLFQRKKPDLVLQIKRKTNTGNLNKNRKTAEKRKLKTAKSNGGGCFEESGGSSAGLLESGLLESGLSPRDQRSRKRQQTRIEMGEQLFTKEDADAAAIAYTEENGGLVGSLAGRGSGRRSAASNVGASSSSSSSSGAGAAAGSGCPRPQLVRVKNAVKYDNDPQLKPVTPMTPFYPLE